MATIQFLALELLGEIFFDADLTSDNLSKCALVCRSWTSEAQRALFHSIDLIRFDDDPTAGVDGAALLESPAFGRHPIRSLTFDLSHEETGTRIFERSGGVKALVVWAFESGAKSGGKWLQSEYASGIIRLGLFGPDILPIDISPPSFHLQELQIYLADPIPECVLLALLKSSSFSLLTLRFEIDATTDGVQENAHVLAAFVTSHNFAMLSTLHFQNAPSLEGLDNLMKATSGIRHLELSYLNPEMLRGIGDMAPPSLETLLFTLTGSCFSTYVYAPKTTLIKLLRVLRLPNLQNLQRLTIPRFAGALREMVAIVRECEERSIWLKCGDDHVTMETVEVVSRRVDESDDESDDGDSDAVSDTDGSGDEEGEGESELSSDSSGSADS